MRPDHRAVATLVLAWFIAILLVDPAGDFPINDDWAYGYAVRSLLNGHWRLSHWTSMPLATQVLWGALFSLPAGFSFTALRYSTLIMALGATLGVYYALRLCDARPALATLAAATFLLCPVVFALSFTFMSDVPFAALCIWSGVFLLRFATAERLRDLLGLITLVVAATLLRQFGLAVAIGAAAAIIVVYRSPVRYALAALIVALPAGALAAYARFLDSVGKPAIYGVREGQLMEVLHHNVLQIATVTGNSAGIACLYLGLFIVPVLWIARYRGNALRRTRWVLAAAIATAATASLLVQHRRMPLLGNIFYNLGLNPVLIPRNDVWPKAPGMFWMVLTAAGVLSAAMAFPQLLARLLPAWISAARPARAAMMFTAVSAAAYLGLVCVMGGLIDRYLILPLALLLMALGAVGAFSGRVGPFAVAFSLVLLALMGAFDIAATHDFFTFSRARWSAVHALQANGLRNSDFNGGFEVNGWLSDGSEAGVLAVFKRSFSEQAPTMIALGPVEHFDILASYPFSRWIGSDGAVYVLQRR